MKCYFTYFSVLFTTVWSADITRKNRTEGGKGLLFSSDCPDFGEIEHGEVTHVEGSFAALRIECEPGYDLIGRPKVLCQGGQWENIPRPRCAKGCTAPPFMRYGEVRIEGRNEDSEHFRKGTVVTYSCAEGFSLNPPNSRIRECKDGIWTGIQGTCVSDGCPWPGNVSNGYFVLEASAAASAAVGVVGGAPGGSSVGDGGGLGPRGLARVGQRAHYNCNLGYSLEGEPTQQCVESGEWSPRLQPSCRRVQPPQPNSVDSEGSLQPCPAAALPPHTELTAEEGVESANFAAPGARLELRCADGFRDATAPCAPFLLVCEGGEWRGRQPHCELAEGCPPPPAVPHGAVYGLSAGGQYPVGAQVAYSCSSGYALQGEQLLTCGVAGCWEPALLPACHIDPRLFMNPRSLADYLSTSSILVVSAATALGVMLLLLGVCAVVVCRRGKLGPSAGRHWLTLHPPPPPPPPPPQTPPPPPPPAASAAGAALRGAAARAAHLSTPGAAGSAGLLDPDRVALIAYADSQLGESALPSYEEAVRERLVGGGLSLLAQYRALHAGRAAAGGCGGGGGGGLPPWAPLGPTAGRRSRAAAADIYVSRQASCAGAGADSTGSTDTMTASEVSTAVTLDTVSSHTCGSSHSASCRAACGSLASFDTASALTSDGVPLLEEQEPDDAAALLPPPPPPAGAPPPPPLDACPAAGSGYCKLRRASPELV